MVQKITKAEGVLSAEEVKSRKARSMSEDFCFVSLVPLDDETRFTCIGHNDQFNVHKKYADSIMKSYNK